MYSCPLLGVRGVGTRTFLGYQVPWVLAPLTYNCAHRPVCFINVSSCLTVPGTVECCVNRCQCGKFKFPCLDLSGLFPSVFSLTWRTWGCGGPTALGMPGWEQLLSGCLWMSLLGPWAASPVRTAWAPAGSPARLSWWLLQYYRLFLVIMRLHIFLYIYRPFGFTVLWSACIFILVLKNLFMDFFICSGHRSFVGYIFFHFLSPLCRAVSLTRWVFFFFFSFCLLNEKKFLLLLFFGCTTWLCGTLVPRPGLEPRPLALKSQSPNYWTAGKVLRHS